MEAVFVVQHVHAFDAALEDAKFIGVYTTEERAREAVARLRLQPGFRDQPDGFHVSRYPLDKDHWPEGYITVDADTDIPSWVADRGADSSRRVAERWVYPE